MRKVLEERLNMHVQFVIIEEHQQSTRHVPIGIVWAFNSCKSHIVRRVARSDNVTRESIVVLIEALSVF